MLNIKFNKIKSIPSIREIQEVLVKIGDKPKEIINSRDWIGTLEGAYIFDELFKIESVLIHVASCEKISSKKKEIVDYFSNQKGLIFMGGDCDAAAKLIAGVHLSNDEIWLLVVDPHFQGCPKSSEILIKRGYVKWYHEKEFMNQSFYNLCMPKIK